MRVGLILRPVDDEANRVLLVKRDATGAFGCKRIVAIYFEALLIVVTWRFMSTCNGVNLSTIIYRILLCLQVHALFKVSFTLFCVLILEALILGAHDLLRGFAKRCLHLFDHHLATQLKRANVPQNKAFCIGLWWHLAYIGIKGMWGLREAFELFERVCIHDRCLLRCIWLKRLEV